MHTHCFGGVMRPGAGTTVERQVAGEFGDRSPVLKPNQTKTAARSVVFLAKRDDRVGVKWRSIGLSSFQHPPPFVLPS